LVVEYDGTHYYGWQVQDHKPTIQQKLEEAARAVTGRKLRVVGAGRTDRGVHALGQVAHVRAALKLGPQQLLRALNANLPDDICVREVTRAPMGFHAQYRARRKLYRYSILNDPLPSPQLRRTHWHMPYPLKLARMRQAAVLLRGRHNFRSFQRAASSHNGSSVRRITSLNVSRRGKQITIDIAGNGFLYNMARGIVGLLVEVGRARIDLKDVKRILSGKDRRLAPKCAPAKGLNLVHIHY